MEITAIETTSGRRLGTKTSFGYFAVRGIDAIGLVSR